MTESPVLFVTHDLARAGAQMLLVRFMEWLAARRAFEFELLADGPPAVTSPGLALLPRAQAVAPVHFIDPVNGQPQNLDRIHAGGYRLIFASSCATASLLDRLVPHPTPVVCHAHELTYWLAVGLGKKTFPLLTRHVQHFVAGAEGVRVALRDLVGIPDHRISVVHDCVPIDKIKAESQSVSRGEIRRELQVSPNTFLITMCGTMSWIKGIDLVIPLVHAVKRQRPALTFVFAWIGVDADTLEHRRLAYQLWKARLDPNVRVCFTRQVPARYFGASDVFALTSQEDPFPLVMLEAAACGLPVIGFDGSGGVSEFVTPECGFTVPLGDVVTMAERIVALAEDPERRAAMGYAAAARAALFDENLQFPRLLDIIARTGPSV